MHGLYTRTYCRCDASGHFLCTLHQYGEGGGAGGGPGLGLCEHGAWCSPQQTPCSVANGFCERTCSCEAADAREGARRCEETCSGAGTEVPGKPCELNQCPAYRYCSFQNVSGCRSVSCPDTVGSECPQSF